MHSKVVIIGSGPAARTAAIYLGRAEMKPLIYEGGWKNGTTPGGQLTTTTDVENYPGFEKSIDGTALMMAMEAQAVNCGAQIMTDWVSKLDLSKRPFKYWLDGQEHGPPDTADAIIIATGAAARRLSLPGEDKYWTKGISACAVCDGAAPNFRRKPLVVIGGGDSAAEEATFLKKFGTIVYVLVRKDKLRASKAMATRLIKSQEPEKVKERVKGPDGNEIEVEKVGNPNVTKILYNTVAVEVKGTGDWMTHVRVKNVKTGKEEDIEASGLFYAVGHDPATSIVKGQIDMDEDGYILTKPGTSYTNVEGVFAAGDVQDRRYRQAITSAGSGCIAALEAEKFLAEQDPDIENDLEAEKETKKPNGNNLAPEYRANPLL